MPVAFLNWSGYWRFGTELPIYIVKEEWQTGWKPIGVRLGESQSWIKMLHPNGYVLEIRLNDFINIIQTNDIINGELQGEWKWNKNEIIKK